MRISSTPTRSTSRPLSGSRCVRSTAASIKGSAPGLTSPSFFISHDPSWLGRPLISHQPLSVGMELYRRRKPTSILSLCLHARHRHRQHRLPWLSLSVMIMSSKPCASRSLPLRLSRKRTRSHAGPVVRLLPGRLSLRCHRLQSLPFRHALLAHVPAIVDDRSAPGTDMADGTANDHT